MTIFNETQRAIIEHAFHGQFMIPEAHEERHCLMVTTMEGTEVVPCDLLGLSDPPCSEDEEAVHAFAAELRTYLRGGIVDLDSICEPVEGIVWRLHAPGYIDSTNWSFAEYAHEAYNDIMAEAPDPDEDDPEPVKLSIRQESYESQQNAGRYHPASEMLYKGRAFPLSAGTSDTVTAWEHEGLLIVLQHSPALDHAGIQVWDLSDHEREPDSVFLQDAKRLVYHLGEWQAARFLLERGGMN